jgi:hypothetical protein
MIHRRGRLRMPSGEIVFTPQSKRTRVALQADIIFTVADPNALHMLRDQ